MLMRALLPLRMRPRVQRAPGIPCALWFMEGQADGKNSDAFVSRECELTSHRRHSGARSEAARARNPFNHDHCGPMDSGLALRAPRNDDGEAQAHPGMTRERGSRGEARPGMTRERIARPGCENSISRTDIVAD